VSSLALLDACILVPQRLSSLLLTVAEHGLFEPRWSEPILTETERALVQKLHLSPDLARHRLRAMRTAFPEASIVGFDDLIPCLQCDPKDRHVLAAAISGGVDVLVTNNVKDFPGEACEPHGLQVHDADQFLMNLLMSEGAACREAIEHEAGRSRKPPLTVQQLLAGLTKVAPTFAHTAHNIWAELDEASSDLPLLMIADEELSPLGQYRRSPNLTDPLHVAFAWSHALHERDRYLLALHNLSWSPRAFGDYTWAEHELDGRAFASKVYTAVDDPTGSVAFVRLIPQVAQTAVTFGSFTVAGARFMIMRRRPDGTWCVWGVDNRMIAAATVLQD
jgi:predicted nucleic acid-binding protein